MRPERIRSRVELNPVLRNEERLASLQITNNNTQDIVLFGMPIKILDPGGADKSLELNPDTSKMTWGGSSKSRDKTIDFGGGTEFLDIAILSGDFLGFIFRSDIGYIEARGEYRIEGELRGNMGDRELQIPYCLKIELREGRTIGISECADEKNK